MDKNNFSQKLAELTALAAVSENKLQMTQVLDAFAKEQVTPEEMESVYAKLEKKGIQILTDVDYYTGIKVFGVVLDRKGVHLGQQEKYELYEKIYEEGMREKKVEQNGCSR